MLKARDIFWKKENMNWFDWQSKTIDSPWSTLKHRLDMKPINFKLTY
jgi:hypothetical protein